MRAIEVSEYGDSDALEDAAAAHQYIEDRKSSGKFVLEP